MVGLSALVSAAETQKPTGPSDILIVSGTVNNAQGKAVKEVGMHFFLDGKKVELEEEVTTSTAGGYKAEIKLPSGTLPGARVEMEAQKPSFKTSEKIHLDKIVKEKGDEKGNTYYLAHHNLTLQRAISPAFWIASLVLLAVYALIAFELMHRTLAAMLGAAVLLFVTYTAGHFNPEYIILNFEGAMNAIDMNVIFLLMAMMIIVGVTKKTGVFQWLAYKSFQMAKGNVFALAAILMFVTAFISAFLDNVTTMLLSHSGDYRDCRNPKNQSGRPAVTGGLCLQRRRYGHPDR